MDPSGSRVHQRSQGQRVQRGTLRAPSKRPHRPRDRASHHRL